MLAALGATALHNGAAVLRLRRIANDNDHDLWHDAVVGDGDPPLRLAVLGDSTSAGQGLADAACAFPQRLALLLSAHEGRRVEVYSFAHRGRRTIHVADEQVPRLIGLQPHVVVVSVGANDALGRRLPRQVEADTRTLIRRIRRVAPEAEVALGGTPPLGDTPALPWPLSAIVGMACRRVSRAQARAAATEHVPFAVLPSQPPEHFSPDGFHGGPEIHDEAARRTVQKLLAARSAPGHLRDAPTGDGAQTRGLETAPSEAATSA